jgi:hypothetical protein
MNFVSVWAIIIQKSTIAQSDLKPKRKSKRVEALLDSCIAAERPPT